MAPIMIIQIKVKTRRNAFTPLIVCGVDHYAHIQSMSRFATYEGIWRFLLISCKDLLDVEHMEAENEM